MIPGMARVVSIAQVLSTCMDANRQGCQVIRDFWKQNSVTTDSKVLKEANEIKSVVTQADIDAQAIIFQGLRQAWGRDLDLIGEEEEEDSKTFSGDATPLRTNLLENVQDYQIPMSDLTVFVDPLDGTREFVEGRIENVACLIGIARQGRAIGGVIGLPFGPSDSVEIHYALLPLENEKPIVGTWPTIQEPSAAHCSDMPTILTGDSSHPILIKATKCAMDLVKQTDSPTHSILGGTAAKLLFVANNPNSMAILHFKSCLWDTCATQALIHAKGGKVTDLFGRPLVYSATASMGNVFGVVASSAGMLHVHNKLCAAMSIDEQAVQSILGGNKLD